MEQVNPYAHKIVLKIAEKLNGIEAIESNVDPSTLTTNTSIQREQMNPNEQVIILKKF